MTKHKPDKDIQNVVSGLDARTGKECPIASCHLMDKGSFCSAMDNAGVPADAKWRALVRFMRGVKDYYPLSGEERMEFQNLLVTILQKKDFSEDAYMLGVRSCRKILMQPYEDMLQSALDETSKMLNCFYNTISVRRDDVVELGENTIAEVCSGKAPDEMVGSLRNAFSKLSQALQEDAETLKELSYQDDLSGIFNRRAFDEHYAKAFDAWSQSKQPLALIMADVDYFKNFNDSYGHRIGDQAIQVVGSTMTNVLAEAFANSSQDLFLARYGGEEFAIVCTNAAAGLAGEVAEACRAAIEKYTFVIRDSKGVVCKEDVQITMSLGVATVKKGCVSAEELLDKADAALYRAKQNGRNRVEGQ